MVEEVSSVGINHIVFGVGGAHIVTFNTVVATIPLHKVIFSNFRSQIQEFFYFLNRNPWRCFQFSTFGGYLYLKKICPRIMASTTGSDDSYPTPTSILSKVGRTPSKHWGSKATDAVRFASFIESAPGNFTFLL